MSGVVASGVPLATSDGKEYSDPYQLLSWLISLLRAMSVPTNRRFELWRPVTLDLFAHLMSISQWIYRRTKCVPLLLHEVMIRALIADDHPIMREGLKLFLICNLDIEVDEVASGMEALEYIQQHDDLDILILDISMPGMDGLETLRLVKQRKPALPVLILSAYSEDQYALRALRMGANGYLMKTSATEELVEAVQQIIEGKTYLSPSIAHRVTAQLRGEERPLHHILSDREFEVMRKIASGKTLTQISQELNLSIKTVSTYRSRILEKMKFRDNADITQYALRHGLLSDAI